MHWGFSENCNLVDSIIQHSIPFQQFYNTLYIITLFDKINGLFTHLHHVAEVVKSNFSSSFDVISGEIFFQTRSSDFEIDPLHELFQFRQSDDTVTIVGRFHAVKGFSQPTFLNDN